MDMQCLDTSVSLVSLARAKASSDLPEAALSAIPVFAFSIALRRSKDAGNKNKLCYHRDTYVLPIFLGGRTPPILSDSELHFQYRGSKTKTKIQKLTSISSPLIQQKLCKQKNLRPLILFHC